MKLYHITWETDLEAETAEEAATKALAVQRNPESLATVFNVQEFEPVGAVTSLMQEPVRIDLDDLG